MASVLITGSAGEGDREVFTGSIEQVRADIREFRDLGANEIIFELDLALLTADILDTMGACEAW